MAATKVNINSVERRISAVLGAILLLQSFMRRSPSFSEKALAAVLLCRGISGYSFLYQVLGINTAGETALQRTESSDDAPEIERSITIEKPADDLYRFWRGPQSLSQIMRDVVEITEESDGRTHWSVPGPFNQRIAWDIQIVEDHPGEMIHWKSLDGSLLPCEGWVRFRRAPKDWGTEVILQVRFNPPGGRMGNKVIKRLGFAPRLLLEKMLRRFKSVAETGEFPTLEHNPSARLKAYTHS
jgi:uncharacterized membrane protein